MTFRLGLTGSIGMGKSTTAAMFADQGCALWDADAAVHRLYSKDGDAVAPIGALIPSAIVNGAISRDVLRAEISRDPSLLPQIEAIVHPLVAADRADFAAQSQADITVFDIPLLFETGGQDSMDAVVCVSVSPEIQENRVMARKTMTRDQFLAIRSRQMPNGKKCALSDFVIQTDTLDHAAAQVHHVVTTLREGLNAA